MSEYIEFTTAKGQRLIQLTESEILAIGWHWEKIKAAKRIEDEDDFNRAIKIIANRNRVQEPAGYEFLDAQEVAIYKHLLTDLERSEIDNSFREYNQGKVISCGKPNRKGVCKGLVQIPCLGRFTAAGRYIPKLECSKIEGHITGEYIASSGYGGWDVTHIKTGLSMLQTDKLKDYQRGNNMSAYRFKKAQAVEIALWLERKELVIGESYNDLIKRVKENRQEVIDNLINVFSPFVDGVAFG